MGLALTEQILHLIEQSGASQKEAGAALRAAEALMPVSVSAPPPGTTVINTTRESSSSGWPE